MEVQKRLVSAVASGENSTVVSIPKIFLSFLGIEPGKKGQTLKISIDEKKRLVVEANKDDARIVKVTQHKQNENSRFSIPRDCVERLEIKVGETKFLVYTEGDALILEPY